MSIRKRAAWIASVCAALIYVSCAGGPAQTPGPSPVPVQSPGPMVRPAYSDAGRTQYTIDVTYDDTDHTARATQRVRYVNTSQDSLDTLYLHIYPKHFSKREYVSMSFARPDQTVYPDNMFNPGDIAFSLVKAAGREADYAVEGEDETVLRISLSDPLAPGQSIDLALAYTLTFPQRQGRYAWGETGTSFANWYPVMAVYDDSGWHLDPYYEIGDPFYTETADYRVTIDMPGGMRAAFTGDVLSDTAGNGRRVLSLAGTGVRDFAFTLSRRYVIEETTVDGVSVIAALPGEYREQAELTLQTAAEAVAFFDRHFGRYIGDTLTVAFVDNYGGMEYPGIVLLDKEMLTGDNQASVSQLTGTLVHEIAHQWWYSAVGNDEVNEPWLDESLTAFSGVICDIGEDAYEDYTRDLAKITPGGDVLDRPLPEYADWAEYDYIYSFGQLFYAKLMTLLGREAFYGMLQAYYGKYAYEVATTEDLREMVVETGNTAALDWFDLCVYGE